MFTAFTAAHNVSFLNPSAEIICAYIHYLSMFYPNPNTVSNYVSALTMVLRRMGHNVSSFNSINVHDALLSIKTNSRFTPTRCLPVSQLTLSSIVSVLRCDQEGPSLKCAVLIMFHTFLRQSNIAPRNKKDFDPTRHLLRADVVLQSDAIIICIKWSKTNQGPTSTSVAAPLRPGLDICPMSAYLEMLQHAPTAHHLHPLVAFRDGTPMPLSYITRAWTSALQKLGISPSLVSLHSLRRGGATSVFTSGAASIDHIKAHGTWMSNTVESYLPNDPRRSQVFQYFKDSL